MQMTMWIAKLGFLLSSMGGDAQAMRVQPDLSARKARPAVSSHAEQSALAQASSHQAGPSASRHDQILARLKAQNALRQARQLLKQEKGADAARLLEAHLAHAGGCEIFLDTLESAYRQHLTHLVRNQRIDDAQRLAARLRVISNSHVPNPATAPGTWALLQTRKDKTTRPTPSPTVITSEHEPVVNKTPETAIKKSEPAQVEKEEAEASAQIPQASAQPKAMEKQPSPMPSEGPVAIPVALAKSKRDDLVIRGNDQDERSPLDQAEKLYRDKKYAEALTFYEQAYEKDPEKVQSSRQRWGYCLLCDCVKRYNDLIDHPDKATEAVWKALEADVKLSQQLAPKMTYSQKVLQAIQARKQHASRYTTSSKTSSTLTKASAQRPSSKGVADEAEDIICRHLAQRHGGWQVTQTDNFIIYHQDKDVAERIGKLAEVYRQRSYKYWFGKQSRGWNRRCVMYLYPSVQSYQQSTGVGPQSPGHATVVNQAGTIISRKLDLRVDDPNVCQAILPHEVNHVVAAGEFGHHAVPRWVDEGMAVLSEPIDKQDAHLANLIRLWPTGNRYRCSTIMTMKEYPPMHRMRDFYAHSVGLSRFLLKKGGPKSLPRLVQQAQASGNWESALRSVYGFNNFAELENEFAQYVQEISHQGTPQVAVNR